MEAKNIENLKSINEVLSHLTYVDSEIDATECIKKSEKMITSIFIQQRLISLLPLMATPSYPDGLIPPRSSILPVIMSPKLLTTQEATPTFIQYTSLFLSYIHTKPNILAKFVAQHYGYSDFHFLVYSAIPSIFGYFTSSEHVEYATYFYLEIVKIGLPHVAISVLQPFLCSMITYRFIENVMTRFTTKFGAELRFDTQKPQKSLIDQYKNYLVQQIIKYAPLLPQAIIVIFISLSQLKWKIIDFSDLFFKKFFNQQALVWVASSAFPHRTKLLSQILKEISKDQVIVKQLFSTFIQTSSMYEIPSCYKVFGQQYIQCLISAADIKACSLCFETIEDLPPSLKDTSFEIFDINTIFRPFLVKIFPKKGQTPIRPRKPVIFPNLTDLNQIDKYLKSISNELDAISKTPKEELINQNDDDQGNDLSSKKMFDLNIQKAFNFEEFITLSFWLKTLNEWSSISNSHSVMLLTPIALKTSQSSLLAYPDSLHQAFLHSSRHFIENELKLYQLISLLNNFMKNQLTSQTELINEVEKQWIELITKISSNYKILLANNFSTSSQYMYWYGIEMMRALDNVAPFKKFNYICSIFKLCDLISQRESSFQEILSSMIVITECKSFPTIFSIFDSHLIMNPDFEYLITKEQKNVWFLFKKFLFQFVEQDEKLSNSFSRLVQSMAALLPSEAVSIETSSSDSSSGAWNLIQQQINPK